MVSRGFIVRQLHCEAEKLSLQIDDMTNYIIDKSILGHIQVHKPLSMGYDPPKKYGLWSIKGLWVIPCKPSWEM